MSNEEVVVGATEAAPQTLDPDPRQFTVHSGCSGFIVVQNGPDDYTLRLVAEGGASSLKFLRLTGPDAFAELSDIWRTLTFLATKFGVPLND